MGTKYLLAIIVLIAVSATSGFLVGRASNTQSLTTTTTTKTAAPKQNTIFTTQTATVQGKISSVSGSKVTVLNEKNQTGEFTLSPKVVIYKFAPGSSQATATQDIKSIETDKNVLVTLELANGQYQVTQIAFLPPPPPPPAK